MVYTGSGAVRAGSARGATTDARPLRACLPRRGHTAPQERAARVGQGHGASWYLFLFTGSSVSCFTRVTCATGRNVQILVGREEVISLLALLGHKCEY